jgi:hypothetical protein
VFDALANSSRQTLSLDGEKQSAVCWPYRHHSQRESHNPTELFRGAPDALARDEPVDRVLEVDIEGHEVTFFVYDLPSNLP